MIYDAGVLAAAAAGAASLFFLLALCGRVRVRQRLWKLSIHVLVHCLEELLQHKIFLSLLALGVPNQVQKHLLGGHIAIRSKIRRTANRVNNPNLYMD